MNLTDLFHHETELQSLGAGQALFRAGDHGELMYVLMSGCVEIQVHGRVVEKGETGAVLGELAMIDDGPRSASVIAVTDCRLLPIARARFNFLVQQTPNFALHVMRVMADRLRHTDELL